MGSGWLAQKPNPAILFPLSSFAFMAQHSQQGHLPRPWFASDVESCWLIRFLKQKA